jgi:glycerol-3-phosphate acyltransferase PlsX
MPQKVRIALDAMGGDHGATVVVPGAAESLVRHPDSEFILFGDSSVIEPVLRRHPRLAEAARVVHTDVAVKMDEKPSQALRHGRWKSSIWLALDAVRKGDADVAVSAGNTGALMAMAKFNLKTIEGIERPAIAAIWPTLRGESVVLDVGASIGADAEHLCDLAAMGSAMARVLFDIERPTVGLLNIGVEEVKGLDEVRKAGQILREQPVPYFEYCGFVEGDDIGKGTVDVVVTEGFAGNIALKTAEGTARQIGGYLRGAMSRTWKARLGYWLAREAFRALREKMDPARSNGGVFLGLNGIVIKSHGGADVEGFAAAVDLGYDMARYELMAKIRQALARGREQTSAVAAVGGAAL